MHLMPCYKVGSIIEEKFIDFLTLLERVVLSAQDKKVQNVVNMYYTAQGVVVLLSSDISLEMST